MACGVHLGILMMCLVQAEHVRCLWASQAQSSHRQNGNIYVGLSQQDGGLRQLGGNYPQNQLRQASSQSSGFNTDAAVNSGYSQGLSSRDYTQTLSQPAQSGYPSVRFVQSSSLLKPNWQMTKLNKVNAQKVPKKQLFGLSTSIVGESSVSKYSEKQNDHNYVGKRTWPVQQLTPHASSYLFSGSASVWSPSKSSRQSAVQQAPSAAAETLAYNWQRGHSSMKSSSLFSAAAPAPQKNSAQMQTSANARARVSSRHSSKASKPGGSSTHQNERIQNNPSQIDSGKQYQSKLFPVNEGNANGHYKASSTSSLAINHLSHSQSLPTVGFHSRSLEMPTNTRLSYKPSYTSTEQIPSSTSSLYASWSSRNQAQGAHNLPASGSSRVGTSAQRFAPTRTYDIPQRFGGFAIRRLKEPVDRKEESVRKPQQTYSSITAEHVF
ncbi:uncharacterized protein LOC118342397 [Morone saxatilis]|uniref:uncharacterized protein LOC118342397 n=1 Tax=Morone saxatilis TaxID=34816 RepID=UPI0015E226AC|nr:uncharacterized protein LOC118342397 [Morone saxatilis]